MPIKVVSVDPFYKIACTDVSVTDNDIFEATDHICSKKKQRRDIKGIFNYLMKTEKTRNVSLNYLSKRIMNLEKEGKTVNRMVNVTDSFYVAESYIHATVPSTCGRQIQSTVSTLLYSYDATSNELKYLQTETAALKSFVLEEVFIIKQNVKLNCEQSPNPNHVITGNS